MRKIHETVCHALWEHAGAFAPHEACGYLLLDPELGEAMYGTILLTPNLAEDPTKEFWLHPDEFNEYRSRYAGLAIWHSHPFGRWDLSRADRILMVETQVPMVVVAWKPWPSVSLYVLEGGQIRVVQQVRVEEVMA